MAGIECIIQGIFVCLLVELEECSHTCSKYAKGLFCVVIYIRSQASSSWFAYECNLHDISMDFNMNKVCRFYLDGVVKTQM